MSSSLRMRSASISLYARLVLRTSSCISLCPASSIMPPELSAARSWCACVAFKSSIFLPNSSCTAATASSTLRSIVALSTMLA
eukprot:48837-Prorocentrum_minimum.AAC.1